MDDKKFNEKDAEKFLADKEHPVAKEELARAGQAPKLSPLEEAAQKNLEARVDMSSGGLGSIKEPKISEIHGANDDMWKNIPLHILPTKGMFYSPKTEITIRAALVQEIRHWSTIDENDWLDMDKKLNFILEKCVRVRDGEDGSFLSWKDIKEIDRFFIVFRIHELTFPDNQNRMSLRFKCENRECIEDGAYHSERVNLNSGMLSLFNMPEELGRYYDPAQRLFVIQTKFGTYKFSPPSVGVSSKLKDYVASKREANETIDMAHLRIAPYLILDWRGLTEDKIDESKKKSFEWGKDEILFLTKVAELMEKAVDLTATTSCKKCQEALRVPLFSREGISIKGLFTVSSTLDDILGN